MTQTKKSGQNKWSNFGEGFNVITASRTNLLGLTSGNASQKKICIKALKRPNAVFNCS